MITIQSGKMIIPEEERFVGFAGDDQSITKQFCMTDASDQESVYTLFLRFDDDRVTSAPLAVQSDDGGLILTWSVRAENLLKAGIVMAQIRINGTDDSVIHTGWDYFIVGASAELGDDGVEIDILNRTEFEERMAQAVRDARAIAPYIGDDGYWYVYSTAQSAYVRSYSANNVSIDSEISASSSNPVENRVVKAYVDAAAGAKVAKTTEIAGVDLQDDITAAELKTALSVPTKTSDLTNDSGFLSQHQDISGKMDIPIVSVPKKSGEYDKEPDTSSAAYQALANNQIFQCTIDSKVTYWIKSVQGSGSGQTAVPIQLVFDRDNPSYYVRSNTLPPNTSDRTQTPPLPSKPLYAPGTIYSCPAGVYILISTDTDYDAAFNPWLYYFTYQWKKVYPEVVLGSTDPPATESASWITTPYQGFPQSTYQQGNIYIKGTGFNIPNQPVVIDGIYLCARVTGHRYMKSASYEYTWERIDSFDKMDLASAAVPANVGGTAPDTTDSAYTALSDGQIFRCVLSGSPSYWLKFTQGADSDNPVAAPVRIALSGDIPSVPTKTSDLTNDSGFLTQHQDVSGKENVSNKVTSVGNSSSTTEYPSVGAMSAYVASYVGSHHQDISGKMNLLAEVPANGTYTYPDDTSPAFTALSVGQLFYCFIQGSRLTYLKTASDNYVCIQPTNTSQLNNDAGFLTQHQDISGKENASNKVTSLSSQSTDTQYPSAKCVYDAIPAVPTKTSDLTNDSGFLTDYDISDFVYEYPFTGTAVYSNNAWSVTLSESFDKIASYAKPTKYNRPIIVLDIGSRGQVIMRLNQYLEFDDDPYSMAFYGVCYDVIGREWNEVFLYLDYRDNTDLAFKLF